MDTDRNDLDPRLAEAIGGLRDEAPAEDLWPRIAPRLAMRRPAGTLLVRWPTALAAGLAIAVASMGGTWAMLQRGGTVAPLADSGAALTVTPAATAEAPADVALTRAIDELERLITRNEAGLDSTARAGITQSLATLDAAIAQATARRRAAPDDPRAARYLTSTLQRKLDVLRTVTTLTTGRS